jgi:hypothetical protein
MTMNRKQREAAAAKELALETAREAGRKAFTKNPEALLAEVWWKAGYDNKEEQLAFCEGFRQARRQHDEYLEEQAQ